MNPAAASALFRQLDRELWVVTARAGERQGGLIATFVSQASLVPELPRMIVGLARQHHTWSLIEASGAFALHLLDETQLDWVWRFGLQSGRDHDKLTGLSTRLGASGAPILSEAPGWLDCRVEARLETGDRTIYLAEVLDAQAPGDSELLTVKRLRQLIPDDRRAALDEQMQRDIAIDAEAIAGWRTTLHRRVGREMAPPRPSLPPLPPSPPVGEGRGGGDVAQPTTNSSASSPPTGDGRRKEFRDEPN